MSEDPATPQPSWRKPAGMFLILALIGGRDYAESQFNRAVKAKRQCRVHPFRQYG